jgi:hypothetical protein
MRSSFMGRSTHKDSSLPQVFKNRTIRDSSHRLGEPPSPIPCPTPPPLAAGAIPPHLATPLLPTCRRWPRHGHCTARRDHGRCVRTTPAQPGRPGLCGSRTRPPQPAPWGLLAMAGHNGRKAEALGWNQSFTVHAFFYFQKLIFCLNIPENSIDF